MKLILVLITLFFLTACIDTSIKSNNGNKNIINPLGTDGSFAEFRNGIDSLELIFYPDPKNQRVFSNLIVHDTFFINGLNRNLQQSTFSTTECSHPFKLYLFDNGSVYKTIYLSDSCNYLAFVQNGNQKFIMLEIEVKQKVDSFKNLMGQMFE